MGSTQVAEGAFPEPNSAPRPRRAKWVVALLVLLATFYVGLALWQQDRIPAGTTLLGVEIGGMQASDAAAKLETDTAGPATAPFTVSAAERTATLDPIEAGLSIDIPATIDSLTGFTLNPAQLWARVFGGGEARPVVQVDATALDSALELIEPDLNIEPVDGTLTVNTGTPATTEPAAGERIDREDSAQTIAAEWPSEAGIVLTTAVAEPNIDQADLDRAMREIVEPLFSGGVTIKVDGHETPHDFTVAQVAAAATLEPTESGVLDLVIDGKPFSEQIHAESPDLGQPGQEASFKFENGQPVIVPSVTGMGVAPADVAAAVRAAALRTENRTETVSLGAVDPKFSTAAAEAFGIKEVVAEFSTPLTADNVRTQNLINGARIVSGTMLAPGETYSLLKTLKPIDAAHGFVVSGVVENGVSAKAMGGGLSQMSTTLYNAAYFSGMDIVQFRPHSRWFDRYPEGRESTLWDPDVDLRFTNKTPYGVVFESWVAGGRLHVRAWSTKYFEIESITSARRSFTNPGVIYNEDPECIAESGGKQGFTVDVTRIRSLNGTEVDRYTYTWRYSPWNKVVCGPPPPPEPAPTESPSPAPATP